MKADNAEDAGRLHWSVCGFEDLSKKTLYEILQLRQRVFVVEQECPYLDADGFDEISQHMTGRDSMGILAAYGRIIPPGALFEQSALGRLVVAPEYRGKGVAHEALTRLVDRVETLFGRIEVRISAQLHLKKMYGKHGFCAVGETYDEDGIDHIRMLLHL